MWGVRYISRLCVCHPDVMPKENILPLESVLVKELGAPPFPVPCGKYQYPK